MQIIKKSARNLTERFIGSSFGQKCVVAAIALVISTSNVMAGSKGAAGFTKATQEVSSYQTPVSNLMKAIAAVIVLVGAFNVYFKMQNGDQDVKKTIMLTIGGCIAFIALSEALPVILSRHDNESGRIPCVQGIAETAGVYGHTRPFPHSGSGSHRRIIRRLHRFLNRFGKGCRVHSHDGHGTGGTDNHLHQAAWRTPQQEEVKRYLYLQKPEKRTVNHFIQYGTQKEKNF